MWQQLIEANYISEFIQLEYAGETIGLNDLNLCYSFMKIFFFDT